MNLVVPLAFHTLREQLRNRSLLLAFVFSLVLLYASVLLGMLAVDQELRVLLDFGLAFIELLTLAGAVFTAATLVLLEMETKTIYLVLTRPVPRWTYLLGRYLGVLLAAACAAGAMCAGHLLLLFLKGWSWQWGYLLSVLGLLSKVAITTALTFLLAIGTTSSLSALTIAAIIWTLGHFVPEIAFLAKRAAVRWLSAPLLAVAYLLPNFQLLNFRDRLEVPAAILPSEPALTAAAYTLAYSAACLAVAMALFKRKEF